MSDRRTAELDLRPEYGDWRAEYRAFEESCALVSRADRALVHVTGDRRVEMLNGLLTNDLRDLEGTGRHALLLTEKGKVTTDLRVFPEEERLLVELPRAALESALASFKKYLPPIYAQFEDVSEGWHALGVYGPRAAELVEGALAESVPEAQLGIRSFEWGGVRITLIRTRRMAEDGVEILAAKRVARELWGTLEEGLEGVGGRVAGSRALDVVRVEWGIPVYGRDITDANLAQETGLEAEAISFDKGCYLGQEVVARIHFRGHVNRLLRTLEFWAVEPPSSAELFREGKQVGRVTTALTSPEFGPIGLGYVRREIEPPAEIGWVAADEEGTVNVRAGPFRG